MKPGLSVRIRRIMRESSMDNAKLIRVVADYNPCSRDFILLKIEQTDVKAPGYVPVVAQQQVAPIPETPAVVIGRQGPPDKCVLLDE